MKYKYLFKPKYPNVYPSGCILEHRYIMEKYLRRLLQTNELVHHKDGNTLNNDIKNLKLTTRREHPKIHFTGQIAWNRGKHHSEEMKKKCGLINKGKHRSPKTEFKKGFAPWNRGLNKKTDKRLAYERPTQFKKGQIPWNKKHISSLVSLP